VLYVVEAQLSCEPVDILLSSHLTLEEFTMEPTDIDLSTLDVDFPKLKSIDLNVNWGMEGAENLLNRCSSSLEKIRIEADLDFSKLKDIYPKLISIKKFFRFEESSKPYLVKFLNRCPRLELLEIGV
jgi:hypothetical protein